MNVKGTPEELFQELTDDPKCLNHWYRGLVFLIPGRLPDSIADQFQPFRFLTVDSSDAHALAMIKCAIAKGGKPVGILGFCAIDPVKKPGVFAVTTQLFGD